MRVRPNVIREWDYIDVAETGGDGVVSRAAADSLVAAARACHIGGLEGENILINGHRRLRAQQVVGVLAAPGATLEILPKIDGLEGNDGETRKRLIHMLARVLDIPVADGAITDLGWQKDDLLEILIRLFCDRLFEALHTGLARRYVGIEDDLAVLRGRLDVKRQFTILAARPGTLACRFEELSPDIPLNQVMKAAVSKLMGIARAPNNQRKLAELSLAFADVSAVAVPQLPWDKITLDRTNASWAVLLSLAKLLLGERFQTTSTGDGRGFSLLFEMNTLFEEYIGRTLQRALRHSGLEVRLQGPRDHVLIGQDGARRFATKPDIVVSRGKAPVLIIDTKWKRLKGTIDDPKKGVGQADIYQMMAYAHVYQCDRLLLLYPHHIEMGERDGLHPAHKVNNTTDTQLSVATISLSNLSKVTDDLFRIVAGKLGLDLDQLRRAA